MAIKDTYAGAKSTMNIFPKISTSQGMGPGVPHEETFQEWLDSYMKRQASVGEYNKLMESFRPVQAEPSDVVKVTPKEPLPKERRPKRYLVDMKTGLISVDEEDGEYDFKEAQLVSQSARAGRGEYDQAIALIKASRGEGDGEGPARKKGFFVEDNGEIVPDAENGDLSLSEARAVSASRRALVPREESPITKEGIELMKRDMKDELAAKVSEEFAKQRQATGAGSRGDSDSPFSVSEKGDLQIRAGAKLSLTEMLLYQNMKGQGQGPLFKDAGGTTMPLPAWLETKRFEREEHRKDEMNSAVTGLFEMGRKELPNLIAGIQNMATSKKAEDALEKGGWGKGKPATKTAEKEAQVFTSTCAQCKEPLSYINPPCVATCPLCGMANVYAAPEQREMMDQALAAYVQQQGKDKGKPTEGPEV